MRNVIFMLFAAAVVLLGGSARGGGPIAAEYFVSPDGDDVNPGTAEKPFRTLQKAADRMEPGDVCTVAAGVYRESVRLARSGAEGKPITFRAAPGAEAILDGTEPIASSWERHKEKIYKTRMDTPVLQLFHDGKMMIEARWPNVRFDNLLGRKWWAHAAESSHGRITDPKLAKTGIDFTGALATLSVAHQFWTWTRPVLKHGAGRDTFEYSADLPGLGGTEKARSWSGNWYYLSGVLAALDAPGEWHYDAKTKTLYLWPLDGRMPQPGAVWTKRRDYGLQAEKSSHLILQGMRFFACAFRITDSDHVRVEDCHLLFPVYARELTEMADPGRSTPATVVQGDHNVIRRCSLAFTPTHGLIVSGAHNLVEETMVHDVCWSGSLRYTGIKISPKPGEQAKSEGGATIRRCTVFNGGNALVHVGGQPNNIVEYCHIHHGGMACKDVSLLYTLHPDIEPTVFRFNWVHDCDSPHIALGIRGDDQTRGLSVHHNVVFNCGWEGITVKGDRNQVYNNTCFNNGTGAEALVPGGDLLVFAEAEPKKPWAKQWPLLKEQNQNSKVYNNAVSGMHGSRKKKDTPSAGKLLNNIIGNAKKELVDPEHFDFRPKMGSRLIDAGRQIPDITDGSARRAPDVGAYEHGGEAWKAGVTWSKENLDAHHRRIEQLRW